ISLLKKARPACHPERREGPAFEGTRAGRGGYIDYYIEYRYIEEGAMVMKRRASRSPEAHLPLPPATFHILLALADGELHGYAIMKGVAARSEGTVRLGPGTLYGSLKRLLEAGLVEESGERADPERGDVRTLAFWGAVVCDVARSAPALRVEAWRARASESTRTMEVIMKLAAMLTLLLGGVIGILNAVIEWVAAAKQTIQGTHELSLVLGVLASALLLAAGVAILSQTPRGWQVARLAVLASLVMIVAARLLFPWMSIFSQLVGIGFPVAILIALYWPRKPSMTAGLGSMLVLVFALSAPVAAAQAKPGDSTRAAVTVKDLPLTAAERRSFVGSYAVTLP